MYIIHLLYPHKDIPLLAEALLGGSLGMVALATGPSKPPCFRWSWGEFAGKVWRLTYPK
jgi:hypothetical protein